MQRLVVQSFQLAQRFHQFHALDEVRELRCHNDHHGCAHAMPQREEQDAANQGKLFARQ